MANEWKLDPRGPIAISGSRAALFAFSLVAACLLFWWNPPIETFAAFAALPIWLLSRAFITADVSAAKPLVEPPLSKVSAPRYLVAVSVAAAICAASLLRLAGRLYASRFDIGPPNELLIALTIGPLLLTAIIGGAKLWIAPQRSMRAAPAQQKPCFRGGMVLLLLGNIAFYAATVHSNESQHARYGSVVCMLASLVLAGSGWVLARYSGCSLARTARYVLLHLLILMIATLLSPVF